MLTKIPAAMALDNFQSKWGKTKETAMIDKMNGIIVAMVVNKSPIAQNRIRIGVGMMVIATDLAQGILVLEPSLKIRL